MMLTTTRLYLNQQSISTRYVIPSKFQFAKQIQRSCSTKPAQELKSEQQNKKEETGLWNSLKNSMLPFVNGTKGLYEGIKQSRDIMKKGKDSFTYQDRMICS